MTTECTEWTQPDGDHFHGLCVNELEPEVEAEGCPICVSPTKAADVKPCWVCDGNIVPNAFTISGGAPGYASVPTSQTVAYERTVISKVDAGTAVARSEWTTEMTMSPSGGGTWTLLPDPSPHCGFDNVLPPYVFGNADQRCAFRVYGEMEVFAYISRAGRIYNNGTFSTFTRPTTPPRTDRAYPITTIDPGVHLEWGPVKVSPSDNPHHLRSIIGKFTLTDGGFTCSSLGGGGIYPPDHTPVLYNFAAELEALRQSLIDPLNTGNPATVEMHAVGFMWVLKLTTATVSGIKTIFGELCLFRRHITKYRFIHNGIATSVTPAAIFGGSGSSFDPNVPFHDPFFYPNPVHHGAYLGPLTANDGPVYILAPISIVNMPAGAADPDGWHVSTSAAGGLGPGYPILTDPDPAIIVPGQLFPIHSMLKARGYFSAPCTANHATAEMVGPNGTSSVIVRW